jgi:hypothetical protein
MKWRLIVAFAWTVAVFVVLLVLPMYSNGSTLFAVNGAGAFVAVGIPVVISAAPLFVSRKARILAGAAMLAFVVIAGMTIGLFYTPSAVILLWPHVKATGEPSI